MVEPLLVPCDDSGDVDILRKIRHGGAAVSEDRIVVIPHVMDLCSLLGLRLGEGELGQQGQRLGLGQRGGAAGRRQGRNRAGRKESRRGAGNRWVLPLSIT